MNDEDKARLAKKLKAERTVDVKDLCGACAHPVDDHRNERWRQLLGECHHGHCSCEMYDPTSRETMPSGDP